MKKVKRCSKDGCDKVIRIHNKSGLCNYHYVLEAKKIRWNNKTGKNNDDKES